MMITCPPASRARAVAVGGRKPQAVRVPLDAYDSD
jgi:hypothetical protein